MIKGIDEKIRLYFVTRSILMGLTAGIIFVLIVLYFGTIDYIKAIMISVFIFTFTLIFSRLVEKRIEKIVSKVMIFLERHKRLRKLIIDNF